MKQAEYTSTEIKRSELAPPFELPVTTVQKQLCNIWSRALGIDFVGINDDFFLMGGESLKAIEMIDEINSHFGTRLPVNIIVECPTVALLEARVKVREEAVLPSVLVQFQKGSDALPPLFLVHGLLGQIYLDPDFTSIIDPPRSVYGIQARGITTNELHAKTIKEVVTDYYEAIESVTGGGPFHLGGFCHGNLIVVELSSLYSKKHGRSIVPILIDPPVAPRGQMVKGSFGKIRLAWRRLMRSYLEESEIERRLNKVQDRIEYWNPEVTQPEHRSRRINTASNMRHLLIHHVLKKCPMPPIILTSEERGRMVCDRDSFWQKLTDRKCKIYAVAKTHHSIFKDDYREVFKCVNERIKELDRHVST